MSLRFKVWSFFSPTNMLAENGECSQSFVFTSNIDGHFKHAGFKEDEVAEIHGSLMEWQCRTPHMCSKEVWTLEPDFRFEVALLKFDLTY
jgi:NAD-dependent SIR2 family protein deacetylase